ncbi:MAG: rod shape-determining protein MreC [Puniceicoccales bacterium]|nr:rod shape-determining protein MreC [Puniceicoccales bacterium]
MKVFLRCSIILIIIVCVLKKSFDPKLFLQSIAVPFLAISSEIGRRVDEILFSTESRSNLIKICKALANENLTLKLQLQKDQDLRNRLQYFEELVQIGEKILHKKVYARVIKRETSAWFESIVVNKGSSDGIKKNALVIGGNHIIGKVAEVSEQFSTIVLTSSPKFRLAVRFENFSVPMVFTGSGSNLHKNDTGKFELRASGIIKNIPIDVQKNLQNGAKIFAASLANTNLDIPLGCVAELHEQADNIFLQATIDLPKTINKIQEIFIIIPDDL